MQKRRTQYPRAGKKLRKQSLKNPFYSSNMPFIPASIAQSLKSLQRIVLNDIDQLIREPADCPQNNLEIMSQALYQQQLKISSLKITVSDNSGVMKDAHQGNVKKISKCTVQHEEKSSYEELEIPIAVGDVSWMFDKGEFMDLFL